jgi:hypothetical protein
MISLEKLIDFPKARRLKQRWVKIGEIRRNLPNELIFTDPREDRIVRASLDGADELKCLSWGCKKWENFFSNYFVKDHMFYQFFNIHDIGKIYTTGFGEGNFKAKKFGGRPERCIVLFSGYVR